MTRPDAIRALLTTILVGGGVVLATYIAMGWAAGL